MIVNNLIDQFKYSQAWTRPNIGKDWELFNIPLTLKLNG